MKYHHSKNTKKSPHQLLDDKDLDLLIQHSDSIVANQEPFGVVWAYKLVIAAKARKTKNNELLKVLKAYDNSVLLFVMSFERAITIIYCTLAALLLIDRFIIDFLPTRPLFVSILIIVVLLFGMSFRKIILASSVLILKLAHKFPKIILLTNNKIRN